jgi:aryl-alcohol dehydrogenase-like predicted oxidoreductase
MVIPVVSKCPGVLARPWNSTSAHPARGENDPTLSRLLPRDDTVNQSIVKVVEEIAKERGVSMAAISTAWCLSKGVGPIVGMNSKERINEVVSAIKILLTNEEIARLEEAYIPKNVMGY